MLFLKQFTQKLRTGVAHNWRQLQQRALSATIADNGNLVLLQKQTHDKEPMKFPSVWLRDNCQCSECFHAHTKSRTVNWKRTNFDIRVTGVSVAEQQRTLNIDWSDQHRSTYELAWLQARDFSPANRKNYINEIYKPAPQLWSKQQYENVQKSFEYAAVLEQDAALLAWLEALAVQGFAMLKNAPAEATVVRKLAERIGYIKRTTYGEVFEVKSKPNAHNYAYLMTPLPLHTDMPYYEYKAGINILHCLVQSQSQGGANLLTDGFNVAERLRVEYAQYYDILRKTPVDWYDIGKDGGMSFHNIWRAPVICLDIDGRYQRINHNITKRDSHFTVPLEQVAPWYEAYDKFLQLAYDEAVEFKTTPGDVFVFNNLRMLHGRTAYEDSPENKRHLIGAYVDWDIIYSKYRILKLQQKNAASD